MAEHIVRIRSQFSSPNHHCLNAVIKYSWGGLKCWWGIWHAYFPSQDHDGW